MIVTVVLELSVSERPDPYIKGPISSNWGPGIPVMRAWLEFKCPNPCENPNWSELFKKAFRGVEVRPSESRESLTSSYPSLATTNY